MESLHKISSLHYLTQDMEGASHVKQVETACMEGLKWIQLRIKTISNNKLAIAKKSKAICAIYGAKLIINDDVELAKEIKAEGVHLGKKDMEIEKARAILGNESIIGATANTFSDILNLSSKHIDYIGLGPYKYTETKPNLSPIIGLEGYKKIMHQIKQHKSIQSPIIAIGGVSLTDIDTLMATGIHGIAVSSAINKAEKKEKAINELITQINEYIN